MRVGPVVHWAASLPGKRCLGEGAGSFLLGEGDHLCVPVSQGLRETTYGNSQACPDYGSPGPEGCQHSECSLFHEIGIYTVYTVYTQCKEICS